MKKIKIGYLPLYIKLYDDNGQDRTPLVRYMNTLISMLRAEDLDVVTTEDLCRTKEEFDRAAEKFNAMDVDAVVTQHLAYSPSLESIDALLSLKAPIIVLDTTPDYSLLRCAGYQNCIDNDHGIHGVQDMCSMLLRNEKPYYICAGHALHSDVIARTAGMCRAAAAKKSFQTMKIGSVGGSFAGMGDFKISDEQLRQQIGATVQYMTPDVSRRYLAKVSEDEIDAEIAQDALKYQSEISYQQEYREATRSGLAIRKWMREQGLGACTVNFLSIDTCGLPKMPFIECCKVLERGQGYAGEGDALTAGLVGALIRVYPNTTFTEMFCPDWENNIILLSHMGESNPHLAQWKPLLADMNFHYNSCGNTVSMFNCYRPGKVIYANLVPMKERCRLILSQGEMLNKGLERGAYRRNTQGWFRPCKDVAQFLTDYSMLGGTHHSAMVYDANISELRAFGEMLGFEVCVIS